MRRGTILYPDQGPEEDDEGWVNMFEEDFEEDFEEEEKAIEVIQDEKDFNEKIEKYKHKLIILFFSVIWMNCPSYFKLYKEIETLAKNNKDTLKFLEIDCDNKDTVFLMVKKYKVLCSPTFVFIKGSYKIATYVAGGATLEVKIKKLKEFINLYK